MTTATTYVHCFFLFYVVKNLTTIQLIDSICFLLLVYIITIQNINLTYLLY